MVWTIKRKVTKEELLEEEEKSKCVSKRDEEEQKLFSICLEDGETEYIDFEYV